MTFVSTVAALSPYAWYRCADTSGGTLADSSGNGNAGTIIGSGWTYSSTSLTSDGSHSLLSPGGNVGLSLNPYGPGATNTAWTIGFLWKPATTLGTTFLIGATTGSTSTYWASILQSNGNIGLSTNNGLSIGSGSTQEGVSAGGAAVMLWYTYDGAGNWSFCVGDQATPLATGSKAWPLASSGQAVYVGNEPGATNGAAGNYQEIMLFNSVLSAANRAAIYDASQGIGGSSGSGSGSGGSSGSGSGSSGSSSTIPANMMICAIGDSRTFGSNSTGTGGVGGDPITQLSAQLTAQFSNNVLTVNAGAPGTYASQWASGQSTLTGAVTNFINNVNNAAFPAGSKVYVQYNVGVNDGLTSNSTLPSNYQIFVQSTINYIKSQNIPYFAGIVLQGIFYAVPGKTSGVTSNTDTLVQQYNTVLQSLVDNVSVFAGDFTSYNFFNTYQTKYLYDDGIHPENAGYGAWAALMAKAYVNLISPSSSSSGGGVSLSAGYASSITAGSVYQVDYDITVASQYGSVHIRPDQPISDPHILQQLLAAGAKLRLHP